MKACCTFGPVNMQPTETLATGAIAYGKRRLDLAAPTSFLWRTTGSKAGPTLLPAARFVSGITLYRTITALVVTEPGRPSPKLAADAPMRSITMCFTGRMATHHSMGQPVEVGCITTMLWCRTRWAFRCRFTDRYTISALRFRALMEPTHGTTTRQSQMERMLMGILPICSIAERLQVSRG